MNVASLELCKRLYELSGWSNPDNFWVYDVDYTVFDADEWRVFNRAVGLAGHKDHIPAYDLGFLMRMLDGFNVTLRYSNQWRLWSCWADNNLFAEQQTPEDAACTLLIELFNEGILKK